MAGTISAGTDPDARCARASPVRSWSSTTACARSARPSAACSARRSACGRRSGSRPSARSPGCSGCCPRRSRRCTTLPEMRRVTDDPLELFHEWVDGDRDGARDRDARRPALGAHGAAEGRRRARLHVLHELRVAEGAELEANPHAALLFHRPGIQVRVEGRGRARAGGESDAYWATRPGRLAAQRRRVAPVRSRSPRARSSRQRSPRSPPSRRGRRTGAATGSCRRRTSSGGTATTGCTNVTCSGDAATAGRCYFCNREGCSRRRGSRARRSPPPAPPRPRRRTLGGCPVFPASSAVEPAGRHAAGRAGLGDADPLDRPRLRACTPTSARASGTARASASRTSSCTARRRRSRASRSTTPTRATRGRTRSRPNVPIEGAPAHATTATGTR